MQNFERKDGLLPRSFSMFFHRKTWIIDRNFVYRLIKLVFNLKKRKEITTTTITEKQKQRKNLDSRGYTKCNRKTWFIDRKPGF